MPHNIQYPRSATTNIEQAVYVPGENIKSFEEHFNYNIR